jgi:hypothetical protein
MSAALAILFGLLGVTAAGGAFSDARPIELVQLDPVVIVGPASIATNPAEAVALACTHAPNSSL